MVRVKMTAILMPSKLDFTFIKPIYNISWYLLVNVVSLILMFFIFFCQISIRHFPSSSYRIFCLQLLILSHSQHAIKLIPSNCCWLIELMLLTCSPCYLFFQFNFVCGQNIVVQFVFHILPVPVHGCPCLAPCRLHVVHTQRVFGFLYYNFSPCILLLSARLQFSCTLRFKI